MSERETKTIQAGVHTVTIKSYLTPREVNTIKQLVYKNISYNAKGSEVQQGIAISGEFLLEQELKTLEVCIISIDGNSADIVNRLQDELKYDEYQQVLTETNEITKGIFTTEK